MAETTGKVDKLRPISPLFDNQLQMTTMGGCAPCEVTQHKYFSVFVFVFVFIVIIVFPRRYCYQCHFLLFLMDDGTLLLFVLVNFALEQENGRTRARRRW